MQSIVLTSKILICRQILSLRSEVFCSLLLSSDVCEVGNHVEVPLEDCTLAEANIFLRYIYMRDPLTDEYQAEGLTKVKVNSCEDPGVINCQESCHKQSLHSKLMASLSAGPSHELQIPHQECSSPGMPDVMIC